MNGVCIWYVRTEQSRGLSEDQVCRCISGKVVKSTTGTRLHFGMPNQDQWSLKSRKELYDQGLKSRSEREIVFLLEKKKKKTKMGAFLDLWLCSFKHILWEPKSPKFHELYLLMWNTTFVVECIVCGINSTYSIFIKHSSWFFFSLCSKNYATLFIPKATWANWMK